MSGVRALCPETCGCLFPYPDKAGFYQAEIWGCPPSCTTMQRFIIDLQMGNCTDDMEGFLSQTESFILQTRLDSWQRYVNGLRDYVYSLGNNAQRILFLLEN